MKTRCAICNYPFDECHHGRKHVVFKCAGCDNAVTVEVPEDPHFIGPPLLAPAPTGWQAVSFFRQSRHTGLVRTFTIHICGTHCSSKLGIGLVLKAEFSRLDFEPSEGGVS